MRRGRCARRENYTGRRRYLGREDSMVRGNCSRRGNYKRRASYLRRARCTARARARARGRDRGIGFYRGRGAFAIASLRGDCITDTGIFNRHRGRFTIDRGSLSGRGVMTEIASFWSSIDRVRGGSRIDRGRSYVDGGS